jgi:TIR domain
MPSGPGERYDFFLSRRGSVAAIAQEVTDVLIEKGYRVLVQDYDIPITANFIEEMHEAVKNSRDLVVLFTRDYEQSPYTRMEFTSFEANAAQSTENRRMVILRCEDAPLLGLFAPHVYQDLVGIGDAEERRRSLPLWKDVLRRWSRHRDRSSECRRVSRASQAALTNLIGSTPF